MKKVLFPITLISLLSACEEKPSKIGKPILLGDESMIVTETDSFYLQNYTNDITTIRKKNSESSIAGMMAQVDSAKTVQKLEKESESLQQVSGFTIRFKEFTAVLDGIKAHTINTKQNELTDKSVSYVLDEGDVMNMKLKLDGLVKAKVEQRFFTKLYIEKNNELIELTDLQKFTTEWFSLPSKNNLFVSLGTNALSFHSVDHNKLKNALDRALRKQKKDRKEIQSWLNSIEKTNAYTDAPCVVKVNSIQWRVKGEVNNLPVQKLIQLDIVAK